MKFFFLEMGEIVPDIDSALSLNVSRPLLHPPHGRDEGLPGMTDFVASLNSHYLC